MQNHGAWLDVRLPSEYQNLAIDGSINIPLYFVRLKLNALDRKTPYVVVCDTGRRSSAAAFILSERGFEAYVLKGGIDYSHEGHLGLFGIVLALTGVQMLFIGLLADLIDHRIR